LQVCCKKTGCVTDGADWLDAPIITAVSLKSAVRLNISDCNDTFQLTGLRYGWRETPFQYLCAAVYSRENNLPAPPFITFHMALKTRHVQQYFVHRPK